MWYWVLPSSSVGIPTITHLETQIEGTSLPSIRSTNDEESQLSERAMLAVRKSRCRKHHPPRLLHNHVREASPIPMPDLPEDILFNHSYAVLSTFGLSLPGYAVVLE
jgi:hypothetical protein